MFLKKLDLINHATIWASLWRAYFVDFVSLIPYLDYSRPDKESLISVDFNSIILKNLSKAYNCLTHDLLMAKLKAFGLDMASLSYEKSKEPKLDPVIVTASNWYVKFSKEFPNFSTSLNSDVFFELQKFNISNFPDNNTLY